MKIKLILCTIPLNEKRNKNREVYAMITGLGLVVDLQLFLFDWI